MRFHENPSIKVKKNQILKGGVMVQGICMVYSMSQSFSRIDITSKITSPRESVKVSQLTATAIPRMTN